MESPVAAIKNNLSVSKIVGFIIVALVVFAVLDVTGLTGWVLSPVSSFKAKFMSGGSSPDKG